MSERERDVAMTDEDDTMIAFELNRRIAIKVMGYRWHKCHQKNPQGQTVYWLLEPGREPPDWWKRPTECEPPPDKYDPKKILTSDSVPHYDKDLDADFSVLCHVRETWDDGERVQFHDTLRDLWIPRATASGWRNSYSQFYEPGDYSRAALAAVESMQPDR